MARQPVLVVGRHQRLRAERSVGCTLQDCFLPGQQAQGGKLILDLLDRDQDLLPVAGGRGVKGRIRFRDIRQVAPAVENRQRQQGSQPRPGCGRSEQGTEGR